MTRPLPQPSDEAVKRATHWRKVYPNGQVDVWRWLPVPMVCQEDADLRGWHRIEYGEIGPIAAHAELVAEVERQVQLRHATAMDALRNLDRAEAAERERDALRAELADVKWRLAQDYPVGWVLFFDDPDPQHEFSLGKECPDGWAGKAEPVYQGQGETGFSLQKRIRELTAQLAQRDEAGARDEREACAQVCNAMVDLPLSEIPAATGFGRLYEAGIRHGLVAATNAIRARAAIDRAAEGKGNG